MTTSISWVYAVMVPAIVIHSIACSFSRMYSSQRSVLLLACPSSSVSSSPTSELSGLSSNESYRLRERAVFDDIADAAVKRRVYGMWFSYKSNLLQTFKYISLNNTRECVFRTSRLLL